MKRASTGDSIRLSSYRGEQAVALVFYPFTFTGICHGELCELRDDLARYEAAGVQVLAISCDTAPAQKKWAEEEGYGFPVLSDFWPHGEVAQAYGVFNDALGCAERATFLIGSAVGMLPRTVVGVGFGVAADRSFEAIQSGRFPTLLEAPLGWPLFMIGLGATAFLGLMVFRILRRGVPAAGPDLQGSRPQRAA